MINYDPSLPFEQPNRRVETKLILSADHEEEIATTLIDTVDSLRMSSDPYVFKRSAEDVPIYHGESHLPARYNLLNYDYVALANGTYKTKISLPGHTLTLDSTHSNKMGRWHILNGNEEHIPLTHREVIHYLQTLLPVRPEMDQLLDKPNVSDQDMNEALWRDISPLTFQWQETSLYNTVKNQYAPSLAKDMPLYTASDTADDYTSSVAAVMGYTVSPNGTKYSCRIGTQLPIDLSEGTATNRARPADVHEEHAFSVEMPNHTTRQRLALATYALESDHLTSGRLHTLSANTVPYFSDVPSIYDKAASMLKDEYLDIDKFFDM